MTETEQAVLAAADRLVAAFARHDRDAYFAAFAPEASFIFHSLDRRLESRAEYEAEWDVWVERDGFRIHGCRSEERRVQGLGPDAAVFIHAVVTDLEMGGERMTSRERETIIFQRRDGEHWLAVHEHLSAG